MCVLIHRAVTVPLLCAFTLAAGTTPGATPEGDQSAAKVANSLQQLERFKSSHSLKDLNAAVTVMRSAFQLNNVFTPENFVAQRRTIVWVGPDI